MRRRLIGAAVERSGAGCGVVRPETVRQVLERHPTRGEDQEAMVRDVCQSGAGVSLVVGRAGTGKTWALGLAREALELAGYQVIGTAPTGIATVSLQDEGFADVRTVDRLLLDLRHGRLELDSRTVLVIDEAGMVGTRKLAPLLDHARRAGAKVVPVGDDRQFASIDTGGGFRGLRLRLGASELTVNRRQVQEWERHAIDLVRDNQVEEAIAVYAEHDRIRAFESRDELALAVVDQWWQAHQDGEDGRRVPRRAGSGGIAGSATATIPGRTGRQDRSAKSSAASPEKTGQDSDGTGTRSAPPWNGSPNSANGSAAATGRTGRDTTTATAPTGRTATAEAPPGGSLAGRLARLGCGTQRQLWPARRLRPHDLPAATRRRAGRLEPRPGPGGYR